MKLKQGVHMLNFDNPLIAKSHFGVVIFPIFTTLPTTLLKAGTHTIYTEVASTEKSREIGLMYRKEFLNICQLTLEFHIFLFFFADKVEYEHESEQAYRVT